MKNKKLNLNEIQETRHFEYKLRKVCLKFSLDTLQDMKDFKILMEKGLKDLNVNILEEENERK